MSYRVEYSEEAKRSLKMMKRKNLLGALRIYNWIDKNLNGCDNPRKKGKALAGQFKGAWRYRIGGYRILAEIHDDKLIILVIEIEKRNTVYID